MLERKMARDWVAVDEREFNESMKTTAPIWVSLSHVSYVERALGFTLTLRSLILDIGWLK